MAWIFSLSAEVGPQKEAAEALACHFNGFTVTLPDGSRYPCSANTFHDGEGWWAMVCPHGVTGSGIRDEQERQQLTAIGFALYERLRSAPAFRFALAGAEVDGFGASALQRFQRSRRQFLCQFTNPAYTRPRSVSLRRRLQ